MSVFSIFDRWLKARRNGLLVRSVRKAVRLLFCNLFNEVELTRLVNEIILADNEKRLVYSDKQHTNAMYRLGMDYRNAEGVELLT